MSGIACPRCSTLAPDLPTAEVICSACGYRWPRPQTRALAWMVQRGEGDEPIGPIDRVRLRELLYLGDLSGRERVRLPGDSGAWSSMHDRPELADILQLLRVERTHEARIQGWQRSPPTTSATTTTTSASAATPSAAAAAAAESKPAVVREVVEAAPSAAPPRPTGGLSTSVVVVGILFAIIAIVALAMNLS